MHKDLHAPGSVHGLRGAAHTHAPVVWGALGGMCTHPARTHMLQQCGECWGGMCTHPERTHMLQ